MRLIRLLVLWGFSGGLALACFALLHAPQPRARAPFPYPGSLQLPGGDLLIGHAVAPMGNKSSDPPVYFQYAVRSPAGQIFSGTEIDVFYLPSGDADGTQLPRRFGKENAFVGKAGLPLLLSSKSDAEGHVWLTSEGEWTNYFGSRISAQGETTITRTQLWRNRISNWRRHPDQLVRWLFTSQVIVDRRALWVQMSVRNTPDAVEPRRVVEAMWSEVLTTFSTQWREFALTPAK